MVRSFDFSDMDRLARAADDACADRGLFDIYTVIILRDYRLCTIHRHPVALGGHMYGHLSGDRMVQKKENAQAHSRHEKGAD